MTKILIEQPPQWIVDACHAKFEIDDEHTIYTYGDAIYNPQNLDLPQPIVAHEEVHMVQQATWGKDIWWKKYFDDPAFRLTQEVEAYTKQWHEYCKTQRDRNVNFRYLHIISGYLASPMYGFNLTRAEAMKLIRGS